MFKTVLRVTPITASGLAGMAHHQARTHSVSGEHINGDLSHNNKVLIGSGDPKVDTLHLVSQYRLGKTTKDPTIAAEFILTAAAEYFDTEFAGWQSDPERLQPWIDAQMAFINDHSAEIGVATSAVLHLDEMAPHLHLTTVPIADVRVKNRFSDRVDRRISYTKLLADTPAVISEARRTGRTATDTKLGRLQTTYTKAMQAHGLRLERGVSNTGRKHIPPKTHRDRMAQPTYGPPPMATIGDKARVIKDVIKGKDSKLLKGYSANANKNAALQAEIKVVKRENEEMKAQLKAFSEREQVLAAELRQDKELLKEYRGLEPQELIKKNLANADDIADFTLQSGRKKFNAIDYIQWKYTTDMQSAVFVLAEAFTPDRIAETAAEKRVIAETIRMNDAAEKDKAVVSAALDAVSDPSTPIPAKPKTPATIAKGKAVGAQLAAIGAERYRITLMHAEKPTYNMGKPKNNDEPERFYTADEVLDLIPTLSHRNFQGYNIFITPMPEFGRRYILLDDIRDMTKAQELQPCLIMQTSPKSSQALYKVDADEPAARAVFNNINKKWGDPKITGLIHPIRLAGFTNRKAKYEKNGVYPFIKILEAAGVVSDKIKELTRRAASALQTTAAIMTPRKTPKPTADPIASKTDKNTDAISEWYQQQIAYWGDKADYSRIDRRLCIKLAESGYTESETQSILFKVSPNITGRHPDIDRYLASKTLDLTFSSSQKMRVK